MGEIGIAWETIPECIRQSLEEHLRLILNEASPISLCSLMTGCIGMNYRWFENDPIKEAVFSRFNEIYGGTIVYQDSGKLMATMIEAMGTIGLRREHITIDLQDAVLKGMEKHMLELNDRYRSILING